MLNGNRWQRNRQLHDTLKDLILKHDINLPKWRTDFMLGINVSDQEWERRRVAHALYNTLIDELTELTGCKPATARGHVSKLLRHRK